MSRHTLQDGVTPDPAITPDRYDQWWPELAPPLKLIGSYYKRGLSWSSFQDGYREHLTTESAAQAVSKLIDLALDSTVTVNCVEDTPERCHRRLLAEYCLILEPNLIVHIE